MSEKSDVHKPRICYNKSTMMAYLLYNRATQAERQVQDLADRLTKEGVANELLDADSPHGIQFATDYDIMARPAVVILRDDGAQVQIWQGEETLPGVVDVSHWFHSL